MSFCTLGIIAAPVFYASADRRDACKKQLRAEVKLGRPGRSVSMRRGDRCPLVGFQARTYKSIVLTDTSERYAPPAMPYRWQPCGNLRISATVRRTTPSLCPLVPAVVDMYIAVERDKAPSAEDVPSVLGTRDARGTCRRCIPAGSRTCALGILSRVNRHLMLVDRGKPRGKARRSAVAGPSQHSGLS